MYVKLWTLCDRLRNQGADDEFCDVNYHQLRAESVKAAELLRLYDAGRRDFRGENLRGQNFKGENLAGADFSGADIHSTNFTNANLTGVKFTQSKAGLQQRCFLGLVVVALLLSALSGFFSAFTGYLILLILNSSGNPENQIGGSISLVIIVVFVFLLLRKGLVAAIESTAGAIAGVLIIAGVEAAFGVRAAAVAGTVAGTGTIAGAGTIAIAIAGITVITGARTAAVAVVIATAIAAMVAGFVAGTGVEAANLPPAGITVVFAAGGIAAVTTLLSAYIGWRTPKGDQRDTWIRSVAIAFAAIGGTSFRGATLTDADFSKTRLKSTDLRRAVLLRTRWRDAEKLDRVRPGESYLNHAEVRQLVLTGEGQGKSYADLRNLTGINLQGANLVQADFTGSNLSDGNLQGATLANARFISANLNGANLQDTDLSNTQLAQTQLDEADLTGATLTGACIEDWNITTRTQLNGIRCDYVFMRLLSDRRPDQNPHRKPDDWAKTFAEGEFVDFITPMVETLDLYHNQTIDPRAVAIAFSDLRQQNPDADLDIISMEKRGQNLDKFNLKVRTNPQADRSQLHHQYFEQYEHLLTLSPQALVALLMEKEDKAQMLAGMINTAITQPKTHIDNHQGDTIMSQSDAGASKFTIHGNVGNLADTNYGNMQAIQHIYAPEQQDLSEAAKEIQKLLNTLAEGYNTTSPVGQEKLLKELGEEVEKHPKWRRALKEGGIELIKVLCTPLGIPLEMARVYLEEE